MSIYSILVFILCRNAYKRSKGFCAETERLKEDFYKLKQDYELKIEENEVAILEMNTTNSELKALNVQLVKSKKEIEQISNYRGKFLVNMSHELRTPLNAIIGFTTVMSTDDYKIDEDESREIIKIIHNSSKKLLGLINNILDLSKIETDVYEPHPMFIDMRNLLDAFVSTAKGVFKDKPAIIFNSHIPLILPKVYADEKSLNKVFMHILENAAKFTSKGEVSFKVSLGDGVVYISLSDTGIGMEEHELDKVFEPFSKIYQEGYNAALSDGVGLGLTISKYFIEKMNGKLSITSKKGYGTNVDITLKVEEHGKS